MDPSGALSREGENHRMRWREYEMETKRGQGVPAVASHHGRDTDYHWGVAKVASQEGYYKDGKEKGEEPVKACVVERKPL